MPATCESHEGGDGEVEGGLEVGFEGGELSSDIPRGKAECG